jgi:tetratricopeptide (TPR) repeat protein
MKRFNSAVLLLLSAALFAQTPAPQQQPDNDPPFVKQAHQLMHDGKLPDALTVFQNELKTSPDSHEALIGAGTVLDLQQHGEEARKYFEKAIASAKTDDEKNGSNRAMAMSWAFEGNCPQTVLYEQKVLDAAKAKNDLTRAAEIANEEARACIDSGDIETANVWYEEGHKLALSQPNLTDAQKDLWNFRMEHAAARVAVRINEDEDPWKHVTAAKAILDKGNIPQQQIFYPYLVGYVAFYKGDYKKALENFQQANQDDPFIQCMIAQTYESLGDKDHATEFYRKAAAATGHNPASAYAIRVAKKKLGS